MAAQGSKDRTISRPYDVQLLTIKLVYKAGEAQEVFHDLLLGHRYI